MQVLAVEVADLECQNFSDACAGLEGKSPDMGVRGAFVGGEEGAGFFGGPGAAFLPEGHAGQADRRGRVAGEVAEGDGLTERAAQQLERFDSAALAERHAVEPVLNAGWGEFVESEFAEFGVDQTDGALTVIDGGLGFAPVGPQDVLGEPALNGQFGGGEALPCGGFGDELGEELVRLPFGVGCGERDVAGDAPSVGEGDGSTPASGAGALEDAAELALGGGSRPGRCPA